ncbi:uncharacterized protein LOC124296594 [Neodiprion lecontei]|uniref:Uncharacterized protein LOC124296594 n=1 Tax=Neodiprion lecontei TaxID=441921 RepID=A0ABM3GQP2_NEOLC|nr:uncharacterized protein LOC124296594 [Neodiprion lecontei]
MSSALQEKAATIVELQQEDAENTDSANIEGHSQSQESKIISLDYGDSALPPRYIHRERGEIFQREVFQKKNLGRHCGNYEKQNSTNNWTLMYSQDEEFKKNVQECQRP